MSLFRFEVVVNRKFSLGSYDEFSATRESMSDIRKNNVSVVSCKWEIYAQIFDRAY